MRPLCRNVRPIMSADFCEARRRALALYKAFYRYIPYIVKNFDIAKSEQDCRCKLREFFYRNACITDVRIIDVLVIKNGLINFCHHPQGYMELKEITHNWQQKGHILANWHPTLEPKPCDFLGKFLAGMD